MTKLYLLEPDGAGDDWAPFTGVRPIAELRAGVWRIRERWEAALGTDTAAVIGNHVAGFHDTDAAPVEPCAPVSGPAVVAAAWFAPTGARIQLSSDTRRLVHRGTSVGWVVPPEDRWDGAHDQGPPVEVDGLLLRGPHDLVTALELLLPGDCADFRTAPSPTVPAGCLVLGDPADVLCRSGLVEPGVVFDVRNGPAVIEDGVEVRHGSRLEGPVYLGAGTRVLGGDIRGTVVGPNCRVHGEIAVTVFLGYSNKSHDGFLGHSVVGSWVNLGAGTTTSNLKNTYGPVRLDIGDHRIDTGRLNLGTIFGDHAKTAIGTMLATGTIVSVGANLFGPSPPPKFVAPFAWGNDGRERLTEEGFLRIAARVMERRGIEMTPPRRRSLHATYERATRG